MTTAVVIFEVVRVDSPEGLLQWWTWWDEGTFSRVVRSFSDHKKQKKNDSASTYTKGRKISPECKSFDVL